MSTIDEIKEATAALKPDEQVELFQWWVRSDTFKARQLAALKRELAVGLEQLDQGRYKTYDDTSVMQLAEDVGGSGRQRLKGGPKNPPAFGRSLMALGDPLITFGGPMKTFGGRWGG